MYLIQLERLEHSVQNIQCTVYACREINYRVSLSWSTQQEDSILTPALWHGDSLQGCGGNAANLFACADHWSSKGALAPAASKS